MSESGPVEINWSDLADHLGASADDHSRWYDAFARELVRPADRLAVDVGCGGGGMISALLEALPAEASVIGVDGNADVLAVARERITAAVDAVDAGRVRLVHLDLEADLSAVAEPATADLVWASAVVHHLGDQQRAVATLAGLLAPGGRLALAEGGLGTRHLPWDVGIGEPGLEGRLVAADDEWFAHMRSALPGSERMPYGWPTALRRAGLTDVVTRSMTIERPAPLDESRRQRVLAGFERRVAHATELSTLTGDDLRAWTRLLDPDGLDWLGHRDDVFHLETRSVHVGVRS